MLRDGSYKPAIELTNQDSLMPFDNDDLLALEVVGNYNHKIKSIKKLNKKIDVYDIEVPHTHNFALASGVFVHNSAKQGRDRKFQAIFPLRGKILNTERARLDKMVASEEIKNLIIAMGSGIGDTFDIKKLRYHRIILMNDADVDGEHITTLGLTFFFRHLPEIVKQGFLYVAMPPLFKIAYGKDTHYVYSEEERDAIVNDIRSKSPEATIGIQRYKGLGEMNPEQLWETTMNPKTRILKKITIDDAQKADITFSTLMGDEVPPRKKFIQSRAQMASLDV
jgi:DNA gyrase subunit B